MKAIKIGIIAAFAVGCKDMNDTYKELIEDGPTIYLQRADSVFVASGRYRVQFTWDALKDPRVKEAVIYWSNKLDSMKVDIVSGEKTQFILDGLKESSYIFDVYFRDKQGHSSIKMTTNTSVYGDVYESYRMNCSVKSATQTGTDLKIEFSLFNDETAIGTQVYWTEDGVEKTAMVEYPAIKIGYIPSIVIENYTGFPVNYRMAYKPTKDCIDTFYSEPGVVQK